MRGRGGRTLAKGSRTSSGNGWNIPEISHNSCRFFPTFTKLTEIQVYHIRLKFANKSCQRGHVPSIARSRDSPMRREYQIARKESTNEL